ncbi:hypothetical protein EVAR_432_1 [Eumeta japonica]|uniref:Secreted protein n=1 Tax=Eumeta variegata TaxID=151549 RepID=A0A4C1SCH3_EUMVA|nr:hypothetical protein EVAR_432_1 [Eumeta japonica]
MIPVLFRFLILARLSSEIEMETGEAKGHKIETGGEIRARKKQLKTIPLTSAWLDHCSENDKSNSRAISHRRGRERRRTAPSATSVTLAPLSEWFELA